MKLGRLEMVVYPRDEGAIKAKLKRRPQVVPVDSALWAFLSFAALGACSVVGGVFLLAGSGWALIAAAACAVSAAIFIRRGMVER